MPKEFYFRLKPEKQKAIIIRCIREFAHHSYANASTDAIAADTGIAKGSLFHYFGSKKDLYLYTLQCCINHAVAFRGTQNTNGETCEGILYGAFRARMEFCKTNPDSVRFISRAAKETDTTVAAERQHIMNTYLSSEDEMIHSMFDRALSLCNLNRSKEEAQESLYMFWMGLSLYLIDPYKDEPERMVLDDEALSQQIRQCFDIICKGIQK